MNGIMKGLASLGFVIGMYTIPPSLTALFLLEKAYINAALSGLVWFTWTILVLRHTAKKQQTPI